MRNIRTLAQFCFLIFVRPVFPALQWVAKVTGIATEAKTVEGPHRRQPYVIGFLQDSVTLEQVVETLQAHGFHPERLAYPDPGQALSMRRLHDDYPYQQYHVRTFTDGEVRGHLEFTPEDRPLAHMEEVLFEETNEKFRAWLGTLLR